MRIRIVTEGASSAARRPSVSSLRADPPPRTLRYGGGEARSRTCSLTNP